MRNPFSRLTRNEDGAAAVEFAVYGMVFFGMLFGGIYASMLGFTSSSLHSAVEAGARCMAMGTTCTSTSTTQTYAASKFYNLTGTTANFVAASATCGNQVSGTINYQLNWILHTSTIALSATSCFPTQSAQGS